MGRRYLTASERLVQRTIGDDPFRALDRDLRVTRREIWFDQIADQVERMYPAAKYRGFFTPLVGVAIVTWSGATSGSALAIPNVWSQDFSATGTIHVSVSRPVSLTAKGIAAGGSGGHALHASSGDTNAGAGAGSGASTTGTTVALVVGKNYDVVIPTAPPLQTPNSSGNALTFTNTTDSVGLITLNGGSRGHYTVNDGNTTGGAGGTIGTGGTNAGVAGGTGGCAGASPVSTAGANNATNGAGGGGGGNPADASSLAQAGGSGISAGGQAAQTTTGGRGGGWTFNGVPCGAGGGGANNDNVTDVQGQVGQQGGFRLAA